MRYIYSIIGAIILLILGTQSAFAQKETTITRTILGCTLGTSTLDSVTIRLQELGAEFEPTNPTTPRAAGLLVTGGVTFASARPRILFIFIDKKLALINIIFLTKDDADRINRNLSLKYKNVGRYHYLQRGRGEPFRIQEPFYCIPIHSQRTIKRTSNTRPYPMETRLCYLKVQKLRAKSCSLTAHNHFYPMRVSFYGPIAGEEGVIARLYDI